jgi:hypothetical protein
MLRDELLLLLPSAHEVWGEHFTLNRKKAKKNHNRNFSIYDCLLYTSAPVTVVRRTAPTLWRASDRSLELIRSGSQLRIA